MHPSLITDYFAQALGFHLPLKAVWLFGEVFVAGSLAVISFFLAYPHHRAAHHIWLEPPTISTDLGMDIKAPLWVITLHFFLKTKV